MRVCAFGVVVLVAVQMAPAQIKVDPSRVSVDATGATSAFLTCGGVAGYVLVEAIWAGEIMDAAPDIGKRAVPGTIYGSLPARYNVSTASGTNGFTAIMSIPPSVTRRAYQVAAGGGPSVFFFVCRFVSETGGPDVYVPVTCELAGGGMRAPFALTNVHLSFEDGESLTSATEGGVVQPFMAVIRYTGTAVLHGRWEIVRPGEDPPTEWDLLTEASLPIEQRSEQRRYTVIQRFSEFLPPTGTYTLRGPDPSMLPTTASGLYLVLLRIEASPDAATVSDLAEVGAGPAPVTTGGIAGFPIPPLRYFVGGGTSEAVQHPITLLQPRDMAMVPSGDPFTLTWQGGVPGRICRVVVIDPMNRILLTGLLREGAVSYILPPWLWTKTDARNIAWSVESLDADGNVVAKSEWRTLYRDPVASRP